MLSTTELVLDCRKPLVTTLTLVHVKCLLWSGLEQNMSPLWNGWPRLSLRCGVREIRPQNSDHLMGCPYPGVSVSVCVCVSVGLSECMCLSVREGK